MSLTPKEKEWILEIERRKKKVVEEELNLKSNFANIQSLMIFSDIFRILRQPINVADPFKKTRKLRFNKRPRYFLGKWLLENKLQEPEINPLLKKPIKNKEMIHVHVHPTTVIPKPLKQDLETYRKFLKR